jgi:hypothetical protein
MPYWEGVFWVNERLKRLPQTRLSFLLFPPSPPESPELSRPSTSQIPQNLDSVCLPPNHVVWPPQEGHRTTCKCCRLVAWSTLGLSHPGFITLWVNANGSICILSIPSFSAHTPTSPLLLKDHTFHCFIRGPWRSEKINLTADQVAMLASPPNISSPPWHGNN